MSEQVGPKVVIIEDDAGWQEIAKDSLLKIGCNVVAIVGTMAEAIEQTIPQLEALGVAFVLVDGNLSYGETKGYEGQQLAAQIKEQAPSVTTVGFSALDQPYVDKKLGKNNVYRLDVLRAVIFPNQSEVQ